MLRFKCNKDVFSHEQSFIEGEQAEYYSEVSMAVIQMASTSYILSLQLIFYL